MAAEIEMERCMVERWRMDDGEMGRWKDGKMERWRDGEMERWRVIIPCVRNPLELSVASPSLISHYIIGSLNRE